MDTAIENPAASGVEYISPALSIISVKTSRIICDSPVRMTTNEDIGYEDWA